MSLMFFSFILSEHLWLPHRHKTNRSKASASQCTALLGLCQAFHVPDSGKLSPGKAGACATPRAPLALVM